MKNENILKDGRQLLIEYDAGHVSPNNINNQRIISEMKNMDFSDDIILYAILQKYGVPNKNGRIYSEFVLKRENERYQSLIKKGGALNELNHPSCHTGDVSILTPIGWKNIKEINDFEDIYTLNEYGVTEIKTIYSKVSHKYDGKMIRIKGRQIDTLVTPNHKFPVVDKKNGSFSFFTAQFILENIKTKKGFNRYYIPKKITPFESDFTITKEILNKTKTKGIYLDQKFLSVEEVDFDDYVYSVDVPNHTYFVKDNNKLYWTGNSSLIDLDRVSHSILETWWEGNVLMGKIKLYTSPGWKKMGIVSTKGDQAAMLIMNGATLGISSRGVGSLKTIKGQNIVQDDYELVCFDLVSSPSTPGAYVFSDPSEKEKYDESVEKSPDNDFNKMKSLMGKLDNFLSK